MNEIDLKQKQYNDKIEYLANDLVDRCFDNCKVDTDLDNNGGTVYSINSDDITSYVNEMPYPDLIEVILLSPSFLEKTDVEQNISVSPIDVRRLKSKDSDIMIDELEECVVETQEDVVNKLMIDIESVLPDILINRSKDDEAYIDSLCADMRRGQ